MMAGLTGYSSALYHDSMIASLFRRYPCRNVATWTNVGRNRFIRIRPPPGSNRGQAGLGPWKKFVKIEN
jgi:hypothetical protein